MQGPDIFASYNVEVLLRKYMRWIRQDPVWMYKLAEFILTFSVFVVGKLSNVFVTNCCRVIQYVGKINQQVAPY